MNLQKRAYKDISSEAGKIAKFSSKISSGFKDEMIHKFRTGLKKLRALSRLFGLSHVVISSYLKKIYRISGKIREGQLLLKKIADENNAPPGLTIWLDSYLEKMEQEWDKLYDEGKIKKWLKKLEGKLSDKIRKPEASFYIDKMQQLKEIKNEYPLRDETIHRGRKLIKDIQYVHDWQEKNKIPTDEILPMKELTELSDEAGKFMDITNELELLRSYIANEKDDEARSEAERLLKVWEKEREAEREKLTEGFKSI